MLDFYNNNSNNIGVLFMWLLLLFYGVCMWRRRHEPVLLAVTVVR